MLEGLPSVIPKQMLRVNLGLRSNKLIPATYLPSFLISPFWVTPYSLGNSREAYFQNKALVTSIQGSLEMREQAARLYYYFVHV